MTAFLQHRWLWDSLWGGVEGRWQTVTSVEKYVTAPLSFHGILPWIKLKIFHDNVGRNNSCTANASI